MFSWGKVLASDQDQKGEVREQLWAKGSFHYQLTLQVTQSSPPPFSLLGGQKGSATLVSTPSRSGQSKRETNSSDIQRVCAGLCVCINSLNR